MTKKKHAIVADIKNNRTKKIKHYRKQVEPRFIRWAKRRFKATDAEVKAAFHKAFEIFCRKITADQFRSATAQPETFLFGIGRNCMLKIKYPAKRKKEKPMLMVDSIADSTNSIDEKTEDDHTKKRLEYYLQKLTPHCASLIRAKKIEGQSIAQITKEKKYKNSNTAKVAISKCFNCLKKIAKESRRKG